MIQELLKLARNTPKEDIIQENIMNNGLYILIDNEGNIKSSGIRENMKEESMAWEQDFLSKFFYSPILNSNKAVRKKIATCNIFSFVTWQQEYENKETLFELFDDYYNNLKKIMDDYNDEELLSYYESSKDAIFKAVKELQLHVYDYFYTDKDGEKKYNTSEKRFAIYMDIPDNLYEKALKCYLNKYLFLDDSYNVEIDDMVLGISSNNNSYNQKKPYIKHFTQPNEINYKWSMKDCYDIYILYRWLLNTEKTQNNGNIRIDVRSNKLKALKESDNVISYYLISGEIKSSMSGTEYIIQGFQCINNNPEIIIVPQENILEIKSKNPIVIIKSWKDFEKFINYNLYEYNLYKKYDKIKANDTLSNNLITILNSYKNSYINAIKYKDLMFIEKKFDSSTTKIMQELINIANKNPNKIALYIDKIRTILNTKYNLLASRFFNSEGGSKMKNNLVETRKKFIEKINSDATPTTDSIDEYCYAVGQLTSYLISKSKTDIVTFKEASSILNCKKQKSLNRNLKNLIQRYKHELRVSNKKLNNLIALTTGVSFEDNEKINTDMILAGFVSNNEVYKKEEVNNEKE